ncbi:MAG: OmpA family protein [Rubrivivax sp.]
MPSGAEPLEVFRNYTNALRQAGFKLLYSCELAACANGLINEGYRRVLLEPRQWAQNRISPGVGSSPRELRYWSGKPSRGGQDTFVVVWVNAPDSIWERTAATVVVIEPAPMLAGQVTVSTEQMQKGLQAEGKIALYGLFFDTGKSEVKTESAPQLEQMAKLLQADPKLKVYIVGHTDNQGSLELNVQLSQRRAEAVASALAKQHGIDAKRLIARGVANLAPVASNAEEAGRTKNRRVQLVAQ